MSRYSFEHPEIKACQGCPLIREVRDEFRIILGYTCQLTDKWVDRTQVPDWCPLEKEVSQ